MGTGDSLDRIATLLDQTHPEITPQVQQASLEFMAQVELAQAVALIRAGAFEQAAVMLHAATEHTTAQGRRTEICNAWLALAKSSNKGPNSTSADSATIETALRQANALDPARATPALARWLDEMGRSTEAATIWHAAIDANPHDVVRYLSLARHYERHSQPERALTTYHELIEACPTQGNYLTVAKRLDELAPALPTDRPERSIRIALVGNATLDHLQSYLKVACFITGLRPQFYQAAFDQYVQEILNTDSQLYEFMPDVVICAIHASRLFPTLHYDASILTIEQRWGEVEAGLALVERLLTTLTANSSAMVLLHNMVAPQHPALGIADLREELGQASLFAHINLRLTELVRTRFQNVYVLDEDRIQATHGKTHATDPRLWYSARIGWSHPMLTGLTKEYLRYLKPYKALGRKCIVLDLDNTLWGGVVGEDGLNGLQLGTEAPGNAFTAFQRELERIWRRGILLAIVSKNNPEDALAVLEHHPDMILKLSHFAAWRIDWASKADNIRAIANELNIGLDSLVFLDDSPVERAIVRAALPQVLTPELPPDPAAYRSILLELDVFDSLTLTAEDRRRNQLYELQRQHREFEQQHQGSGSVEEYLAALKIKVEIAPADPLIEARIAQLTNKTNQFNLTTRRYSEAQIRELQTRGARVYGMRVSDRFGDNGLVGVAIVTPAQGDCWEIDTLLLSCRVMGRGVETALLAFVVDAARKAGVTSLEGRYIPTAKNAPAKRCYPDHGFHMVERTERGDELWRLLLGSAQITPPPWLTL